VSRYGSAVWHIVWAQASSQIRNPAGNLLYYWIRNRVSDRVNHQANRV
jgi:hypothetical protein